MFLLDTNIVSDLRKLDADSKVKQWANGIPSVQTFISTITILEIERGVLLMERRDQRQGRVLRQWLDDYVLTRYRNRIISVDTRIAQRCAFLHVQNPMPEYDALIAATALENSLTVVTRNVRDFERTGVKLLNPWAT